MAKVKPKAPDKKTPWQIGLISFLSDVMNRCGLVGFIVLAITIYIFSYASEYQKKEIIDTWILFKSETNVPAIIAITALSLLLIMHHIHYNKLLKIKGNEVKRLMIDKNKLQQALIDSRTKFKTK